MKYLEDILPNENTKEMRIPVLVLLVGAVTKYIFGGYVLDLIGHLLIFLGCINIVNYFSGKYGQKLNYVAFIIVLIVLFIATQMLSIQIFNNYLNIDPIFMSQ